MERIDKIIGSVLGVTILGGGAVLGLNMTTDTSEVGTQVPFSPRITTSTKVASTTDKSTTVETTEAVVVETETQINDYIFTETTPVPMPPETITETIPTSPQINPQAAGNDGPRLGTDGQVIDPDSSDNRVYKNCDDVGYRIYWNEYGYAPKLDRDRDGLGCEHKPERPGNESAVITETVTPPAITQTVVPPAVTNTETTTATETVTSVQTTTETVEITPSESAADDLESPGGG
jgi:hypothetical protein